MARTAWAVMGLHLDTGSGGVSAAAAQDQIDQGIGAALVHGALIGGAHGAGVGIQPLISSHRILSIQIDRGQRRGAILPRIHNHSPIAHPVLAALLGTVRVNP